MQENLNWKSYLYLSLSVHDLSKLNSIKIANGIQEIGLQEILIVILLITKFFRINRTPSFLLKSKKRETIANQNLTKAIQESKSYSKSQLSSNLSISKFQFFQDWMTNSRSLSMDMKLEERPLKISQVIFESNDSASVDLWTTIGQEMHIMESTLYKYY